MTTVSSPAAQEVAAELGVEGHIVRTCSDSTDPRATWCAALRNGTCPLDAYPIDAAVNVGAVLPDDGLANGGLCAVRRRIPLVLVDRPGDPLEPWAMASVPHSRVAATIAALDSAQLPAHTAEAGHTLVEELAQQRRAGATDVVVRRRNGGLVVELSPDSAMSRRDTERLAVHVAQRLRAFDPWARTIDVSTQASR
jgi:hypothetical protein